ncbi:surface antigen BspA-like [Trichomonas vaginalis G3]|uniref:Surface antigen BspA-like n=1 Tax=Trichomonas vaginalis (strain ATCC PRA-98 / G3) TaxID=412133 RepID=A2F7L1_TRIV3|nr:leucine-rich repeats (6 copies)-containing protein [Trichomonas vaginalis G3]EAX99118.1 surface antigen BspA-like [Trichomonas vaginalis G3]KAI5513560.1 leucine-rich repeats (6 copies)-containing protein [Trichomonas vaginalis G3]|eukprot:XP_001312048.1 surface antigen BspA-like [Trichomonas vaginalis G3]
MKMPVNLSYLDYDNLYMLPNYLITNKNETVVYDYFGCESNIDLMDSVNEIYNSAFENNSYIESVSIPSSVRTIGSHAFKNCSNLKTIIISNQSNLEVIQYNAFKDCKCIDFIQNFTSDKYYAVNNTIIERSDISTVLYHAPLSPEESISISYDVIGSYSFEYSINIIQITIEDSVSRINEYAFHSCSKLKFLTINKAEIEIEEGALSYCYSLLCIKTSFESESFAEKIRDAGFRKKEVFKCIPQEPEKTIFKDSVKNSAVPFLYSAVAS